MRPQVDDGSTFFGARAKDALLFLAAFGGVVYPVILAYRRYGVAAPFKFFANDAFYYLNVAKRSHDTAFYTYDGSHATNGFHPLWQWVLSTSFRHLGLRDASDGQLLYDYGACAVLCALGAACLAVTVARLTGSRFLGLLGVVPGFYDLVMSRLSISLVDATETTPWSFVNGMETGLSVFFFGLFAWFLFRLPDPARSPPSRLLLLSGLVTLMTLSRLDDVFLLVAFVAAVAWASKSKRELLRNTALAAVIPTLAIGAYLAYNLRSTGLLLPVSGSAKRNLAAAFQNLGAVKDTLVPTLQWSGPFSYSWDAAAWRVLQLCVPLAVALSYLVFAAVTRARPDDRRGAMVVLAGYAVMKGAYNFFFVSPAHQGHWYFPISIEITNVILALAVARLLKAAAAAVGHGVELHPAFRARIVWLLRALAVATALAAGSTWRAVLAMRAEELASGVAAQTHGKALVAAGVALVAAMALAIFARPLAAVIERVVSGGSVPWSGLATVLGGVFIVLSGSAVVNQKADGHYSDLSYELWRARHEVDSALAAAGASGRVFEVDDGIMGYALEAPTMNALGLSVDREAQRYFAADRCFDVAYERGFDVLSSVTYWSYLDQQRPGFVPPVTDAEVVETILGPGSLFSRPCGSRGFAFSVLRVVPVGGRSIYFLQFKPRAP